MINRCRFLQSTFAESLTPGFGFVQTAPFKILLRSSWQTVSIGRITLNDQEIKGQ